MSILLPQMVVLDTTKVQIFKQITTLLLIALQLLSLFQIPQRYRFSSKSQHDKRPPTLTISCFRYHKGTDFQANHNTSSVLPMYKRLFQIPQRYRFSSKSQRNGVMPAPTFVVLDTTKVQIFKQITTGSRRFSSLACCFRYHKGTDFQANHNQVQQLNSIQELFQIPQRYRFSSKSQHISITVALSSGCFRYHKGTDFQANHNIN